jgi:hypothetical protein
MENENNTIVFLNAYGGWAMGGGAFAAARLFTLRSRQVGSPLALDRSDKGNWLGSA